MIKRGYSFEGSPSLSRIDSGIEDAERGLSEQIVHIETKLQRSVQAGRPVREKRTDWKSNKQSGWRFYRTFFFQNPINDLRLLCLEDYDFVYVR